MKRFHYETLAPIVFRSVGSSTERIVTDCNYNKPACRFEIWHTIPRPDPDCIMAKYIGRIFAWSEKFCATLDEAKAEIAKLESTETQPAPDDFNREYEAESVKFFTKHWRD